MCKSTLQFRKISHSETLEKFQCENFNEIFMPTKFHEIYHHYCHHVQELTQQMQQMRQI